MISQSEKAAAALLDLIERGDLAPGSMVSERSLMDRSGFGRTPIREAVQRLTLIHMLRIYPNKGIEVTPMSAEDQLSGLEARRPIELLAVALACERGTSELVEMRTLAGRLEGEFSIEDYRETVCTTHELIVRAARNPYLEALLTPLQVLSRRFWLLHLRDASREIAIGKELHRAMLTAVADRDVESAQTRSAQLNDYLVQFALDVVASRIAQPRGRGLGVSRAPFGPP